ncbi:disulfide bond formation protein DsbB [Neptunicella sp. SCSIO 80796]|uniref:disulfide bond formation protein DsbB n=1 Tax=Neptunicella plasticusilytica TaxID=3117012 RepID=UPI003A4D6CF5
MLRNIAIWPEHAAAWKLLFISTLGLELAALYFQYVMDLAPCIMCIYQRTAVFGIMLSALVGIFLSQNILFRLVALTGWGVSAIWGTLIAYEHVDIQTAANPFFASCEIVPNFPSWLKLHEWVPQIFAATGDCGDIDWQFMQMSMPQWMMAIFAAYSLVWALVLVIRLSVEHKI